MNIISTQYTLKYKSLEIVISGCSGNHCSGCHSPETWDFNVGTDYRKLISKILNKIEESSNLIDWIWVYGGEPLDNNINDLEDLLYEIKAKGKPIMLFTRYSIDDVPQEIKELCDYIKCGAYKKELTVDDNIQYGVKLATKNQKIYKKTLENKWV
jgi:anaerobic ribonucleoside-triphosphate reductase activating protein